MLSRYHLYIVDFDITMLYIYGDIYFLDISLCHKFCIYIGFMPFLLLKQ